MEGGKFDGVDAIKLNAMLVAQSGDGALTCPVTGKRVPISQWQAHDHPLALPNISSGINLDLGLLKPVLMLTSPAGGAIFLDLMKMGLMS